MFWHAGKEGDSWTYLWVTIAVWLGSILVRVLWYIRTLNIRQSTWFQWFDAEFTPMSGGVTKVDVSLPEEVRARPGQHCFLRFPAVSLLDNHPFTLAWSETKATEKVAIQTMTFFIRSRRGFTKRLHASSARKSDDVAQIWVDGLYGRLDAKLENSYHHMVLVAGGIGITGCLPWVQHFLNLQGASKVRMLSSLKLVWVVREADDIEWADEYLHWALQSAIANSLEIEIHYTTPMTNGQSLSSATSKIDDIEKAGSRVSAKSVLRSWQPVLGRPKMSSVIGDLECGNVVIISEKHQSPNCHLNMLRLPRLRTCEPQS